MNFVRALTACLCVCAHAGVCVCGCVCPSVCLSVFRPVIQRYDAMFIFFMPPAPQSSANFHADPNPHAYLEHRQALGMDTLTHSLPPSPSTFFVFASMVCC